MEPAEAQQAAVAFRCWWLHQPNWFPLVFIAFILDSLLLVLMGDSFPSLFTDALFHLSSCSAFLHYFFLIGPFHSQVLLSASILISSLSQNPTPHWKHFLIDRIPSWHVTLTVTVIGWVCCAHISNLFFCLACHAANSFGQGLHGLCTCRVPGFKASMVEVQLRQSWKKAHLPASHSILWDVVWAWILATKLRLFLSSVQVTLLIWEFIGLS